jgi:hypothetical protein
VAITVPEEFQSELLRLARSDAVTLRPFVGAFADFSNVIDLIAELPASGRNIDCVPSPEGARYGWVGFVPPG